MILIKDLGLTAYEPIWQRMQEFTKLRLAETIDECWLLEHYPVYTQGQAGKAEHILNAGNIPIVQSDRGGQVTYHGPGQLIGYFLLNLTRLNIGIRDLVRTLESLIISLLKELGIVAENSIEAPGVYVEGKKIASIGLRVKNGYTYHGIAINTAMDLTPFTGINPCGFSKMPIVQIKDYLPEITLGFVKAALTRLLLQEFNS